MLACLLERPNQVVTRETLQQVVWGDGTHVDFDRGLNFCIAQIRSALGDSADSPRYIRTLPKKGYQFLAPVTRPDSPAPSGPPAIQRNYRFLLLPLSLLLMMGMFAWQKSRPPSAPGLVVAVFRLDNDTGDPAMDRMATVVTDSLIADLTETGGKRFAVIGNPLELRQPRAQRDLL